MSAFLASLPFLRLLGFLAACALQLVTADPPMSVTIENYKDVELEIRYVDSSPDGVFINTVLPGGVVTVKTYVGHRFTLVHRPPGKPPVVKTRFQIKANKAKYRFGRKGGNAIASSNDVATSHDAAMRELRKTTDSVDFLHAAPANNVMALAVSFQNFRRYDLRRVWDDGSQDGVHQDVLPSMRSLDGVTTYIGHAFKFMRVVNGKSELVHRCVIRNDVRTYIIEPEPGDTDALKDPAYVKYVKDAKFDSDYKAKTGLPWLGDHPPIPPALPIYEPGPLGTRAHQVRLRQGVRLDGTIEDGQVKDLVSLSPGPPEGPRLFLIEDLLSAEECQHIINISEKKLARSQVGTGDFAQSRTSSNTFVSRSMSAKLEAIHKRFADVLGVTDDQLRGSAEALQVVRYAAGEEYQPHHDYMRGKKHGNSGRLATLLVYLDVADSGGGTSFPRAYGNRGLRVRPRRGSAVLFYSQLPDGNLDELSAHGGMRVMAGVKRVCNLWMHSTEGSWREEL